MLTLKVINEDREEVIRKLAKKRFAAEDIINQIVALDETRRSSQTLLDSQLSEINLLSKSIGGLMKEGKKAEAEIAKQQVSELKELSKLNEAGLREAEAAIQNLLVIIPNLPHDSVPEGKSAEDNLVERSGGNIPQLSTDALPHWELAIKYDLIDFE